MVSVQEEKPLLRGVSHQYGFFLSLLTGSILLWNTPIESLPPMILYVFGVSGLLASSALFHRGKWTPKQSALMRRIDRTMIFVLIAGSYTPFGWILFDGWVNRVILQSMWLAVVLGVVFNLLWLGAPNWLRSSLYLLVGWLPVLMLPEFLQKTERWCLVMVFSGGVAYSIGAVIYACKKPNIWPDTFGFHELFHLFVLLGISLHYTAMWALF